MLIYHYLYTCIQIIACMRPSKPRFPILEQMFVRVSSYIRAYKAYCYSMNIIVLRYGSIV